MEGWILGLHLLSAHLGDLDPGAHPRTFTPGIYAVAPSGVTAGAYRNSLDKDTVYLGWTWRTGWSPLTMALVGYVPLRNWSIGPMSSTRIMQADTQ